MRRATRRVPLMTAPATRDEIEILRAACVHAGVDDSAATPLHRHATSVWLLPAAGFVARISHSPDDRARATQAIAITRWLVRHDFPATAPAPVDQPVQVGDVSVTFWRYYPQNRPVSPGAAALGALLRRLHQLPTPPVVLPAYAPLVRIGQALERAADLPEEVLAEDDRTWLIHRRHDLLDAYRHLESTLGVGMIHGDAYPGNTLWNGDQPVLGDWDEIAWGPRELDLINTHQGVRVGRSAEERAAFSHAYGWDVTTWPGFPVLREMRDVHTLGAYLDRAAGGDQAAAAELRHRVQTLRAGEHDARWHVV